MRVASSDWWASRKVVSVTATAVCSRSASANASGPGGAAGPARPAQAGVEVEGGQLAARRDRGCGPAVRLVDGDLGEVGQQLGAAVGGNARGAQLGPLVDEGGAEPPRLEVRAPRAGPAGTGCSWPHRGCGTRRGAPGPPHRGGEVRSAAGELDQHGVEVRADLGAHEDGAAVEPHAGAARRAVRRDPAGVGPEPLAGSSVVMRHCSAAPRICSRSCVRSEVIEGLAAGDPQLGPHEVDVGDLLGHRVLDLDARVHLDEDVAAVGREEELHRAGVDVADLAREGHGVGAHALAQLRVEVGRRRDLDDLLVAALHRAVALEQVDHVAGARRRGSAPRCAGG